jgi:preprotein translocase subunit SecF
LDNAKASLAIFNGKHNPLILKVTEYKNRYSAAKIRYDNDTAKQKVIDAATSAKQAEIDLEAYETQKQLEAEASARNVEKQKDFEIEKEKSAIVKAEKSAKMKKYAIYGGIALSVAVLVFVGYKKGVFKNFVK